MPVLKVLEPTVYLCSIGLGVKKLSGHSEGSRAYNLPLRYRSWGTEIECPF